MTDNNIHIYNYTDDKVDAVFSDDTMKSRIKTHVGNNINGTVYIYESEVLKALIYIDNNLNPGFEFKDNTFSGVSFFQIFYVKMRETSFTNDVFIEFVKSLTNDEVHKITFIICTGYNDFLSNITKTTVDSYTISKISPNDKDVSVYDTYILPNKSQLNYVVITKGDGEVKEGVNPATSTEEVPQSEGTSTAETDAPTTETNVPSAESTLTAEGTSTTESEAIINVDTKNENDTTALVQNEAQLGVNNEKIDELTSTINKLENATSPLSGNDKKDLNNAELSLENLKDENKELIERIKEDEAQVTKDDVKVSELQEKIKQEEVERGVAEIKEEPTSKKKKSPYEINLETKKQSEIDVADNKRTTTAKKINSLSVDKTSPYNKKGGKRRTKKNKGKKVGK